MSEQGQQHRALPWACFSTLHLVETPLSVMNRNKPLIFTKWAFRLGHLLSSTAGQASLARAKSRYFAELQAWVLFPPGHFLAV